MISPANSSVKPILSGNDRAKGFRAGAARVSNPSATSATSMAAITGAAIWIALVNSPATSVVTASAIVALFGTAVPAVPMVRESPRSTTRWPSEANSSVTAVS